MEGSIDVYFPMDICFLINKGNDDINKNYILSNYDIRNKVRKDLKEEFNKYYNKNKLLVFPDSDPEQRLELSMKFLNGYLDKFHVNTLKAAKSRRIFLQNFILISKPLSVFLNKKKSSEIH